jgi:hypothetical protein
MTLFIAYLLEMGIYDCYSFNQETKQVEYDFSKDPRFKFLDAFKRNGILDPKDKTNLAVYNMLMEEFNKTRADGDKLKFGDDLPDGICDVQVDTIKNLANQIHGTMDPETKMHASQYWWAQMMLKF